VPVAFSQMEEMTRVARCCCGSLQAEAVADPVFVGACHCKKCQWRTGAPFDVSASFRKADVSTNGLSTAYVRNTLAPVSLSRSHFPRRPNRQLQYLAERRQILVTWPAVISLPEVNARCAHADLLGNFHHRETTLDPRVTEITRETWLTRQCCDPSSSRTYAIMATCRPRKREALIALAHA
jgi:hypothetical protein